MLTEVPFWINMLYVALAFLTVYWFWYANNYEPKVLYIILALFLFQSAMALSGFLLKTDFVPPPIMLSVFPSIAIMLAMFLTRKGRAHHETINLERLHYLHTIRIPVEFFLVYLFHQGFATEMQTFEGANFDVISGISAPFIAYFGFTKKKLPLWLLIGWNAICAILLLIIIVISVLSFPTPFQQLSIGNPSTAMLYFPYNLLASLIAPLALYSHFIALSRLLKPKH